MTEVILTIRLTYPTLESAIRSAHELKAITGIDNESFELNESGQSIGFSSKDAYQVSIGRITTDQYLNKHKKQSR